MSLSTRHRPADWGLLLALTVLWGSAFLFTKIAVSTLPSPWVVVGRLAIGAVLLVPLAIGVAARLPPSRRLWIFLVLMALFGNALPFTLIAWGQRFIDSGLAGILMAVMPLATLSLSHYLVPGERLTVYRLGGFALGFVGVVVLMGPEALLGAGTAELLPMLAVLTASFCYAISAILARLRPPSDALSSAAATTSIATLMVTPTLFVTGGFGLEQPPSAGSLGAVLVLGVFSTALATVLYFRLIRSAGPAFMSQLNYFIPLWAVLVGVLFLGERPELKHLLALVLILGGVLLAQLERRAAAKRATASAADPARRMR
ncbi:MAG: DMT family transporter [Chromatiaceae bacterium]|nr:DMT family transporter [Chromatiaceae bacterium]